MGVAVADQQVEDGAPHHPSLGNLNTDITRQPHDGELIGGQPRKDSVGNLDDPVSALTVRGEHDPVPVLPHGELHPHSGQGKAYATAHFRSTSRVLNRAVETRIDMSLRVRNDLNRSRQITTDPHEQVDLPVGAHSLLSGNKVSQPSLGKQVREPGGHTIRGVRPLVRVVLEPPAENRAVGTVSVVTVKDELCKGVSTMNSTNVLTMKKDRVDRLDHDLVPSTASAAPPKTQSSSGGESSCP